MNKELTGTKEWAGKNINIQVGCENTCRYCYAAAQAARFKRCKRENWHKPVINNHKVDKAYRKSKKQPIFFASTHDITPGNLSQCLCVLRKLLNVGNEVLIVSKPRWACIPLLCETLKQYQKQIEFRFTIGSTSDEVLRFWEPNAPSFCERLTCLEYAFKTGYKTSVSCEPYLDGWPLHVYEAVRDLITGDFWLGKLNHFNKRVDLSGVTEEQMQRFVRPLQKLTEDVYVREIYRIFKDKPQVKFKDSFRKVAGKSRRIIK